MLNWRSKKNVNSSIAKFRTVHLLYEKKNKQRYERKPTRNRYQLFLLLLLNDERIIQNETQFEININNEDANDEIPIIHTYRLL